MTFETEAKPTRVVLVIPQMRVPGAAKKRTADAQAAEARGLAEAIRLDITRTMVASLNAPNPSTLFGSGKVEEIAAAVAQDEAELIYVDGALTPGQQRNLEKDCKAKVIDRTGLILEIFGDRANTREGVLQVELAHLSYQKSRLVRSWTHLERQRGGFGFLGGPGETQIETDRRLIQERITKLKGELEQVKRTRLLQRKNRDRTPFPSVALVGYTNAGKSTLFNRLTGSSVVAADLLFATLDPTLRRLTLPSGGDIILSDTVGFVADLPTQLVAAFLATLEEVISASLILHVRDITHDETELQASEVYKTLAELGIGIDSKIPILEVWNKIDLLPDERRDELSTQSAAHAHVSVSSQTGEGCEDLLAHIESLMAAFKKPLQFHVKFEDGEGQNWVYRHADILEKTQDEEGIVFTVRMSPDRAAQARNRFTILN